MILTQSMLYIKMTGWIYHAMQKYYISLIAMFLMKERLLDLFVVHALMLKLIGKQW